MKSLIKKCIPDEIYLKYLFKKIMGRPLNLKDPTYFNDKLQWLKLYNHDPQFTEMVDKYEAKKYVANMIGEKYIIPTLGVWDHFDDIDFDSLPNQFVLKCTHDSGSVIVCKDKHIFDKKHAKEKLEKALKNNFYWTFREWPYKNIKPRIIAEEYIVDEETQELRDYKFFCFNGIADNVMMVSGRSDGKAKYFHFDKNWELCRFNRLCRSLPEGFSMPKPIFIDEMYALAERLSKGLLHVRVDLYYANGQIYFGEYTFFNESGFETGFDDYSDSYLGSLIKLPQYKRLTIRSQV